MSDKIYEAYVNWVDYDKLSETEKDFVDKLAFGAASALSFYLTDFMDPQTVTMVDASTDPSLCKDIQTFLQYAFGNALARGFEKGMDFFLLVHPKVSVHKEPIFKLAIFTMEKQPIISCYCTIEGLIDQLNIHFQRELEKAFEFLEENLGKTHADMKRMVTSKDYISSLHASSTLQDIRFGFKVST